VEVKKKGKAEFTNEFEMAFGGSWGEPPKPKVEPSKEPEVVRKVILK